MNIVNDINKILMEKIELYREIVGSDLYEARIKLVTRVRGGKIQRRKKVKDPSLAGKFKLVGGKLVRETAAEKMRRKRAGKKAAMKGKAKQARALIKRKRSMKKRATVVRK